MAIGDAHTIQFVWQRDDRSGSDQFWPPKWSLLSDGMGISLEPPNGFAIFLKIKIAEIRYRMNGVKTVFLDKKICIFDEWELEMENSG